MAKAAKKKAASKKQTRKAVEEPDNETEGVDLGGDDEEGLVVDMTDVDEDVQYENVPRGIYPVVLQDLEFGFSQRSGNPMWTWVWEVEGGDYDGRRFWFHTTFNEGGIPRCKRTLARIGSELAEQSFKPEKVALSGVLLGSKARARVDIRPYKGKPRNNVRDILPPKDDDDDGFLED